MRGILFPSVLTHHFVNLTKATQDTRENDTGAHKMYKPTVIITQNITIEQFKLVKTLLQYLYVQKQSTNVRNKTITLSISVFPTVLDSICGGSCRGSGGPF